ncbi:hypothetical protein WL29_22740 [Burkholderia ubonensis]|uniref:Uncharacterized protein n=1 Tax=Burkholderia ubonensis TaxID=101571 RepID=A0A119HFM6_9BURK|nr:hypothetical protein [Burkholderia ubonensis]KWA84181.1 hypothetical protein WL29_22740 [Burkholderia ubonensis]
MLTHSNRRFKLHNTLQHPVTIWLLALAITLLAGAANAAPPRTAADAGWSAHEPNRYVVSGVLRLNSDYNIVKPVHAIIEAKSDADAIVMLMKQVEHDWPDYGLISTLATPVPKVATCLSNL